MVDRLDRYAAEWSESFGETCREHHRGERSDALFDLQVRCLDHRRNALRHTTDALALADADVVSRTIDVTGRLPPLATCRDLTALASESPVPDPPVVAARVDVLRGDMARAELLSGLGRASEALALATEVVASAAELEHGPTHASALLLRGRLGLHLAEEAPTLVDWFTRAVEAGFAAHVDGVAAEALALRIYASARQSDLAVRALDDEALALALTDRSPQPSAHRGLVLNNVGTVHLARQEPDQARAYFIEALALREAALGPAHREVAYTLLNLAVVTAPGPTRLGLLTRALEILEHELGPAHPEMVEARTAAAHLVDPPAGRVLLRPACLALDDFLAGDLVRRSRCRFHLGRLATEVGDDDEARASFLAADASAGPARAGLSPEESALIAGHVALVTAPSAAAIAPLRAALNALPEAWWTRADAAELRLCLGQLLLRLGRAGEARTTLAAAVADYAALAGSDAQYGPPHARARRSLAEALLALGEVRAARSHLLAVTDFYRHAGPGFAGQLAITDPITSRATR